MGLLSYFKRSVSRSGAAPRSGLSDEAIAAARNRARQRLIGAAVLVVAGVVTLPMLFDREPRPLPPTAAIEMASQPGKDEPGPAAGRTTATRDIEEVAADAGQEMPAAAAVPRVAASAPSARSAASSPGSPLNTASTPTALDPSSHADRERRDKEQRDKVRAERERAAEKERQARERADRLAKEKAEKAEKAEKIASENRARELMNGQKANAAASNKGRFVVQIGAFSDQNAATQARSKADKLGVKTYTQVIESASGSSRIRVRVGPFQDRAEAEKTLARLKSAGVTGVVLTL